MNKLLVVGSVAYDDIETPYIKDKRVLGGSATFFSTAASIFTHVKLVAVVGDDFEQKDIDYLKSRDVDIEGLQIVPGKTFSWGGTYSRDMNQRQTLFTHLGVYEDFNPILPESYRDSAYVFLANIDPDLQYKVLDQISHPKFIACDTMNLWINTKIDSLKKILRRIDALIINDQESYLLSGETTVRRAARVVMDMGPRVLIIKRGEHGAMLFHEDHIFYSPAFPLEKVIDPTGAGDTFAGGFMGFLAHRDDISMDSLKIAMVVASAMASFSVEQISINGIENLTIERLRERYDAFKGLMDFPAWPE
jgi:sugar/nucleoside kinase (ribokinase family)